MVAELKSDIANYSNLLEPFSLVEAFLDNPPIGFSSLRIPVAGNDVPGFTATYDLFTTLDDSQKWIKDLFNKLRLDRLMRLPTIFVGTTVSEYLIAPRLNDFSPLLNSLSRKLAESGSQLMILKDLPCHSPLLSEADNKCTAYLKRECLATGNFISVSGQALAYVPINFCSMDEYIKTLTYSRRKDIRRKLRARAKVNVEEIRTGNTIFWNEAFTHYLYQLYLNVYEQSKYHFDKLTYSFFCSVLQDHTNDGIVFIYRSNEKIIGYNICFIYDGKLVDKYVGFVYPDARDANLYFVSWFYNLEYALRHKLQFYVAGWTDPEVKAALGARFTFTEHLVFIKNPIYRAVLKKFRRFFEADQNWAETQFPGHKA